MNKFNFADNKQGFIKLLGDDKVSKLEKILSATEKTTSVILPISNEIPLSIILYDIAFRKECWKDNPIVRLIVNEGFVLKVQTHDNGTPIIYVFDEYHYDLDKLDSKLKVFCELHNLTYTKIEC